MAARTFQFRLITPQGKLIDSPATYASLPAHDGLMGVLPNRAPMVVKLGLGELKVDVADEKQGAGGSRAFLVEDGFAQMAGNKLTILAARAAGVETLTESGAAQELAAAEAKRPEGRAEAERVNKDRERARVKLRLARSAAGKPI
ncbi:MAG: FoF1 ATP synthase subunit delta/epsilon [Phycisphaerales bacterium]